MADSYLPYNYHVLMEILLDHTLQVPTQSVMNSFNFYRTYIIICT